jgi:hypothetical protein
MRLRGMPGNSALSGSCDTQAPGRLDGLRPCRAICAGARENHDDRALLLLPGEGTEEIVHRAAVPALLHGLATSQRTEFERDRGSRPDDINGVRLDPHAVLDLKDGHGRATGQDVAHQALAVGR